VSLVTKQRENQQKAKIKTPFFILELSLRTEPYQVDILEKRFEIGRNIYNACLNQLDKRYSVMRQSKEFQHVMKQIKASYRAEEKQRLLQKNRMTNHSFKEERKELWGMKNKLHHTYGLTEYHMHQFVAPMSRHFKDQLDSLSAQQIASQAWQSMEKLLYGNGKKIHYKKVGQMNTIAGKWNRSGLRYKEGDILWKGLTLPVIIKKSDTYAQMALTNRIKYCRVKRKIIRGNVRYFVQIVLEGIPPKKIDKETGLNRHQVGQGKVGLDIGTKTLAIVSEQEVKLVELAPHVQLMQHEKTKLSRKLDRQQRANNPHKYNKDGTIKQGNKEKWVRSKSYLKTLFEYQDICRKQADIRRQDHYKLANRIIALGHDVKVETMNYTALTARSKETKRNEKTGKYKRKKRFGKSIAHKAPSLFLSILKHKLSFEGLELNYVATAKVKASQYNHVTDTYEKKELNERWNRLPIENEPVRVQRDLYSAYLIMNVQNNLEKIDREACINGFESFKRMHDKEIIRIQSSPIKRYSSMGI
jgi:hypothetical protein